MKRIFGILMLVLCLVPLNESLAASDPQDSPGSKEPALFKRMPGFYITDSMELDFEQYEFPVGPEKMQAVEGHYYFVQYSAKEGVRIPSSLQIVRNYINAAKAIGGKTVYEYEDAPNRDVTIKVVKDNGEAWVLVKGTQDGWYQIYLVEKKQMSQEVTADAESLAGSINETGKAAVYGIYFDTGKSVIKTESEAALGEITKLLKNDASLKVNVVGHTDNVGGIDSNMKLSQARAEAVVKTLTGKYGIAAARLKAYGVASLAPVASNDTEDGKAKNRRVELVKQ
jgi:OOP family OmpA-OmpF porin